MHCHMSHMHGKEGKCPNKIGPSVGIGFKRITCVEFQLVACIGEITTTSFS